MQENTEVGQAKKKKDQTQVGDLEEDINATILPPGGHTRKQQTTISKTYKEICSTLRILYHGLNIIGTKMLHKAFNNQSTQWHNLNVVQRQQGLKRRPLFIFKIKQE